MASQQEQRATSHSKRQQKTVNLEEGPAQKLEEQEKKKQPRKRQADGDISEGPSTKKTRLEEKISSYLVEVPDQQSSETQSCEELSTRKEETISKSSKMESNSEKATQRKHKPTAMDDVSNKLKQHEKGLLKQRSSLEDLSANSKAIEIRSKVKEQYSQLSRHARGRPMNPVQYLTHCTNEKRKGMIESSGKLLAKSAQHIIKCPLAVGQKVKGVWLTATTERSGTPLPKSPYGTERINIPVSALIISSETIGRWSLFFESTYYSKHPIQYVRFVLLDTQSAKDEHITWCKDYLLKVDIEQNPFVCWNGEQLSSISNHDRKHANIYVEILKVGEIETQCGHWDTVKETRKTKNTDALVYLSLCPLLRNEGESFEDTGTTATE